MGDHITERMSTGHDKPWHVVLVVVTGEGKSGTMVQE